MVLFSLGGPRPTSRDLSPGEVAAPQQSRYRSARPGYEETNNGKSLHSKYKQTHMYKATSTEQPKTTAIANTIRTETGSKQWQRRQF